MCLDRAAGLFDALPSMDAALRDRSRVVGDASKGGVANGPGPMAAWHGRTPASSQQQNRIPDHPIIRSTPHPDTQDESAAAHRPADGSAVHTGAGGGGGSHCSKAHDAGRGGWPARRRGGPGAPPQHGAAGRRWRRGLEAAAAGGDGLAAAGAGACLFVEAGWQGPYTSHDDSTTRLTPPPSPCMSYVHFVR